MGPASPPRVETTDGKREYAYAPLDERGTLMIGSKRLGILSALGLGLLFLLPVAAGATSSSTNGTATAALHANHATLFNRAGNVLITDQFNNRVIEVNPLTQKIVWSFGSGNGSLCNPGPGAIIGVNSAERLGDGLTLMTGTGIGSGIPNTTACVDNRVIVVNQSGGIVWQYGKAGVTGSGPNQLNVPVFALQLPNHHIMIVDQGNNRVIEVNLKHTVVWKYGPTSGPGALNSPNSVEQLPNGHLLIADENNNRVIEITRAGALVHVISKGLNVVAFASRLPNHDTLIADSGNNRVVELTPSGHVAFQFYTNSSAGSNPTSAPTDVVAILGGDYLIADQFNNRVIVVDPNGTIVYQYGQTNVVGHGAGLLYAPYSAAEIGDYTGQTHPSFHFF